MLLWKMENVFSFHLVGVFVYLVCAYAFQVCLKTSYLQRCLSVFCVWIHLQKDVDSCCIYPRFIAPWPPWGPAGGHWSWSTCLCCKSMLLKGRELILCPRNYKDSTSRSALVRMFACTCVYLKSYFLMYYDHNWEVVLVSPTCLKKFLYLLLSSAKILHWDTLFLNRIVSVQPL